MSYRRRRRRARRNRRRPVRYWRVDDEHAVKLASTFPAEVMAGWINREHPVLRMLRR